MVLCFACCVVCAGRVLALARGARGSVPFVLSYAFYLVSYHIIVWFISSYFVLCAGQVLALARGARGFVLLSHHDVRSPISFYLVRGQVLALLQGARAGDQDHGPLDRAHPPRGAPQALLPGDTDDTAYYYVIYNVCYII